MREVEREENHDAGGMPSRSSSSNVSRQRPCFPNEMLSRLNAESIGFLFFSFF
jgi:hypothetical protein